MGTGVFLRKIKNILIWAILATAVSNFAFCSGKVIIPIEKSVRDTVHEIHYRTDSIFERDSIMVEARGDTLIKEIYRWRERTRHHTDTIIKTRVDSIPVPVVSPSKKENLENKGTSFYSKLKRAVETIISTLGTISLVLLILWIYGKVKR